MKSMLVNFCFFDVFSETFRFLACRLLLFKACFCVCFRGPICFFIDDLLILVSNLKGCVHVLFIY